MGTPRRCCNDVPADRSEDEEMGCGPFAALPEEVLEMVLAAVPADPHASLYRQQPPAASNTNDVVKWDFLALLSLRLVCRRWSRVVLSPAVWRHRRVVLRSTMQMALLRLVPAVDTLTAIVNADMLRALADSACRVRSLELTITASVLTSYLVSQILEERRGSLRALSLRVSSPNGERCSALLAALDWPSGLRALTLHTNLCTLDHEFGRLDSLERLTLGGSRKPHESCARTTLTGRSLVLANKEALLQVDAGPLDLLQQLALCARLKSVVVAPFAGLRELCELPQLESLMVRCCWPGDLVLLDKALEEAESVPPRVGVVLCSGGSKIHDALLPTADGLRRVRRLELNTSAFTVPDLLKVFEAMTGVEVLVLNSYVALDFKALHRGWEARSLPSLRAVHVDCWVAGQASRDWLAVVKESRPGLETRDGFVPRNHFCEEMRLMAAE